MRLMFFVIVQMLFGYIQLNAQTVNSHVDSLFLNYNYDEARIFIEENIKENNISGELFYKFGIANKELEKHSEAIIAFQNYLGYHPNNIKALMQIASSKSSLGLYSDAEKIYSDILFRENGNSFVRKKLAETYRKAGKYNLATEQYISLFKNDSTNSYYAGQVGYCATKMDSFEIAIDYYSKAISLNPFDERSRINYCKLLLTKEYTSPALLVVEQGLNIDSVSYSLRMLKAGILYRQSNYLEAVDLYKGLINQSDSSFVFLKKYGFALYFTENYDEALEILLKAKIQKPGNQLLLFVLGMVYSKLNELEKSEEFLKLAIEFSLPERMSDYYKHLGDVQNSSRKIGESIISYKKAYSINEENKTLLFHIATSLEEFNSDKTVALVYYEQFLEQKNEDESPARIFYASDRVMRIKEILFFEEE